MNSAGILMNIGAPAPAGAPAAESQANPGDGFTAALAALQEDPAVQKAAAADPAAAVPEAEDVSALAIIASLLLQGSTAAANDAAPDEAGEEDGGIGDSSLLAVATSASVAEAAAPASAAQTRTPVSQDPALAARNATTSETAQISTEAVADADVEPGTDDASVAVDVPQQAVSDKLQSALSAALPAVSNTGAATQSAAAAIHLATTLTRDAAADASPVTHTIREPVGSPRWAEAIGSRLVLMSMRGQQEGSLTLTPAHLGPVEVQISVNKDTANIWFGAQHADTRAALADAMPRLRELLAASGLSLGQSGVSEQAPRRAAGDAVAGRAGANATELAGVAEAAAPAWRSLRSGLIDTYA
jgi:flagellar hook-length control protein FliK